MFNVHVRLCVQKTASDWFLNTGHTQKERLEGLESPVCPQQMLAAAEWPHRTKKIVACDEYANQGSLRKSF